MNRLIADQARRMAYRDWELKNDCKILSCGSPDSEFHRQYARDMGGESVPDPMHIGLFLVIRRNAHD